MVRSQDCVPDTAGDGGSPRNPERQCTIYEVRYPDERRRASGEPGDEAVSTAFFGSRSDALAFQSHNGGEVYELQVSLSQRQRMRKHLLIR